MHDVSVLITAQCRNPKGAKSALAAFSSAQDGVLTTSTSGFVVLHEGRPLVLTSAAAVYPLLSEKRRKSGGLAGCTHADLAPGSRLHAAAGDATSARSAAEDYAAASGGRGSESLSSSSGGAGVELRLVGTGELPGVRAALLHLLNAPSMAGPAGWQLGWLLHQQSTHPHTATGQQRQQPPLPGSRAAVASSPLAAEVDTLEAACHVAVLRAATPSGTAALARRALPWPDPRAAPRLQPGQTLVAVGAPFGSLAPQHFSGFLTTGVVSAVVGGGSGGEQRPALLLSDLRCCPGMEGGPVMCAATAAGAAAAAAGAGEAPAGPLAGMLLPPLKAPAAQVELTAVAPAAAVAEAAAAALAPAGEQPGRPLRVAETSGSGGVAPAAAAGAIPSAAQSVVAVMAGGSWASGVIVSSAGHVLTNAHLLQPTGSAAGPPRGGRPAGEAQVQLAPASASAGAAAQAPVQVLLPPSAGGDAGLGGSGGSAVSSSRWRTADVLCVFSGPLDLAVLQLRPLAAQSSAPEAPQQPWQPLELSEQPPRRGQPLCVVGYAAFSPRGTPLGGPLVTAGALAKVLRTPSCCRPAMLLTTAAVHSGASGGAVVDAATGRLLGLVTSNAKHSSGGGPGGGGGGGSSRRLAAPAQQTILPHLNFSIPAAALKPVVEAAEAAGSAASALAAWRALDADTTASEELLAVWRLDPRQRQRQAQRQRSELPGGFGGAAPPAKLRQLLQDLPQQQQQQQRSRL